MPWRESCAMEQRGYFMLVAATGEVSFAALCRQFGISRDTGYRWLRRWRAEGGAGLVERSRAPRGATPGRWRPSSSRPVSPCAASTRPGDR